MTTLPKYLTQDELKRFFAAIDSPRDRALFGLIYHYGLRVGEALMLTVDDVNFHLGPSRRERVIITLGLNDAYAYTPEISHSTNHRIKI